MAEVVDARLSAEVVRFAGVTVRALPPPRGERWLALHLRMTPPQIGASLSTGALFATGSDGRPRPARGIAGWDAEAPGPTFLLFADLAHMAQLSFPPVRGPGWATTSVAGRGRTSVSYHDVASGRLAGSFTLSTDKSGGLQADASPMEAVFLFAVPVDATRFTVS